MRTPPTTDSSRTASHTQTTRLSRPVKYAPVMRHHCRPHVVKIPSTTSTIRVGTAV